jgi:hypothetical protein
MVKNDRWRLLSRPVALSCVLKVGGSNNRVNLIVMKNLAKVNFFPAGLKNYPDYIPKQKNGLFTDPSVFYLTNDTLTKKIGIYICIYNKSPLILVAPPQRSNHHE